MGVKSTYTLNRSTAESIVIEKINNSISELSDQQLADILECFPESYYRNYCVDEPTEDDLFYGTDFIIMDMYDFKNKL
jgi:hypothetical protein